VHSENAILDAMDSFSEGAGDLMQEVYQYMTPKCYMYLFGCMEGRKRSIRRKATRFVIVFFLPLFYEVFIFLFFYVLSSLQDAKGFRQYLPYGSN